MSIVVTLDVECEWPGCLTWTHGAAGLLARGQLTVNATEAREAAEKRGFSRRKLPDGKMGDVCWEHRRGNGT